MSYGKKEDGKDILLFVETKEPQSVVKEVVDTSSTSSSASPPSTQESQSSESASSPEQMQQEAFNEETGEINWDCPCLGPMTKPPCGEAFKEAFSCFVFSKEEPKGLDCVEKFRAMQDCFREHPDIYGEELDDDGDENEARSETKSTGSSGSAQTPSSSAK